MSKKKSTKKSKKAVTKKEITKKDLALKWTTRILFILLVLLCLFIIYYIVSVKIYRNTGYKYRPFISMHAISSPSMTPALNVDDVVVDYLVKNPKDIKVGDVITFLPDNYNDNAITITHRVVQVIEKNGVYFYKTKGDNNKENDSSLVSFDNILGKVLFKIPYVGKMQFLLKKQEFNSCFYFLKY